MAHVLLSGPRGLHGLASLRRGGARAGDEVHECTDYTGAGLDSESEHLPFADGSFDVVVTSVLVVDNGFMGEDVEQAETLRDLSQPWLDRCGCAGAERCVELLGNRVRGDVVVLDRIALCCSVTRPPSRPGTRP